MALWPLAVAVAFILVSSGSQANTRPDFSGTWMLASDRGFCPGSVVLQQDESSLRVQTGGDTSRALVYRFDGTDTGGAIESAPARPADLPPTAYHGRTTRSIARAAWNGDRFVVVVHSTMTMTWPSQVPGEFDRETVSRATYFRDTAGRLIVEHRVIVDPLPGGAPRRIDVPDSWTCAYKRIVP